MGLMLLAREIPLQIGLGIKVNGQGVFERVVTLADVASEREIPHPRKKLRELRLLFEERATLLRSHLWPETEEQRVSDHCRPRQVVRLAATCFGQQGSSDLM